MRSMTGYGRAQGSAGQTGFRVEISAINRKQVELKFSLPPEIAAYEGMLRQILTEKVSRGAVTFRVSFPAGMMPETVCTLDTRLAKKLMLAADGLAAELGKSSASLTMSDLLRVPGVVRIDAGDCTGKDTEELLRKVAEEAVDALVVSREKEGEMLANDIRMRLNILRDTLEKIIPLAAALPEQQFEKMKQRLNEYSVADSADERLLRELAIFADKLDVTEEITRLKSHFIHFAELLENRTEPVGRQLDFMVQEIFREINTLGNKAAGVEISPLAVLMKTELEKIREQIQNIE